MQSPEPLPLRQAAAASRSLAALSPDERAQLLPTLQALDPDLPRWKRRPLPIDIARAALSGIKRGDAASFFALDAALRDLGVDLSSEELNFATITHMCGNHVLHLALAHRAEGIVRQLLASGADPNSASGGDALRPLHVAVLADDASLIHALLAHGADPNLPDALGRSARHLAETVAWKRDLKHGHAILNGEPRCQ